MLLKLTNITKKMVFASREDLETLKQKLEDLEKDGYLNLKEANDIENQTFEREGSFHQDISKVQVI